jgi:hypothetical protein
MLQVCALLNRADLWQPLCPASGKVDMAAGLLPVFPA